MLKKNIYICFWSLAWQIIWCRRFILTLLPHVDVIIIPDYCWWSALYRLFSWCLLISSRSLSTGRRIVIAAGNSESPVCSLRIKSTGCCNAAMVVNAAKRSFNPSALYQAVDPRSTCITDILHCLGPKFTTRVPNIKTEKVTLISQH